MSTIPLPDVRYVAAAASVSLFTGYGVANRATVNVPLTLAHAAHSPSGAYDPSYYCPQSAADSAYNLSYYVPTLYPVEVSDIVRLLVAIQGWTGWSGQDLVNLAFPPYSRRVRITSSGAVEIDAALCERVESISNVVEHIYAASGYDSHRTDEALTRSATVDGESALTYLMADRFDEAYLEALRVLRPSAREGLATGRGTRPLANATVAFLDED